MKIIAVFFLLFVSLFADGNRTVPSDAAIENARVVALQGWEVAEKPLNDFFKKDGDKYIQAFLKYSKKPFSKDTPDAVMTLNLTRDDNFYALAYAKYLENQEMTEEALNIYKSILSGIKQSTPEGVELLSLTYKVTIEELVTKSLTESVKANLYTKKQRRELKTFLANHLLLDPIVFLKALENDRKTIMSILEKGLVADNNATKNFNGLIDHNIPMKNDTKFEELVPKICKEVNKRISKLNQKLYQVASEEENEQLYKDLKNEEKTLHKELNREKTPEEIEKLRADQNEFINSISGILFYVSIPKLLISKPLILERIELNKRLLELL